jgi:hypothetical protein
MVPALKRRFTAREFNHDPSAVSRAARAYGRVMVTNRGREWLIVADATKAGDTLPSDTGLRNALEAWTPDEYPDELIVGEPEKRQILVKIPQLDEDD